MIEIWSVWARWPWGRARGTLGAPLDIGWTRLVSFGLQALGQGSESFVIEQLLCLHSAFLGLLFGKLLINFTCVQGSHVTKELHRSQASSLEVTAHSLFTLTTQTDAYFPEPKVSTSTSFEHLSWKGHLVQRIQHPSQTPKHRLWAQPRSTGANVTGSRRFAAEPVTENSDHKFQWSHVSHTAWAWLRN